MLTLTPVSLAEANAFVAQHHRHHKPVTGHKFSIGCTAEGRLVGVAIVGRPVSRYLDNGLTLEVNRLCTDGTKNACSMLYALREDHHLHAGHRVRRKFTRRRVDVRGAGWREALDGKPTPSRRPVPRADEIPI